MQLCINHLVEQRYYRQSVIGLPDNCLQEALQDYNFLGRFCVRFEFCLCWIFGQFNCCSVELFLLDKDQSNGSHKTVFLTLGGPFLAAVWSNNLSLLMVKLLLFVVRPLIFDIRLHDIFLVLSYRLLVLRSISSAKSVVGVVLGLNRNPGLWSRISCGTLPWNTRLRSQSILEWYVVL